MMTISGCESVVSSGRIWWPMNGGRPPLMSLIWTGPDGEKGNSHVNAVTIGCGEEM